MQPEVDRRRPAMAETDSIAARNAHKSTRIL